MLQPKSLEVISTTNIMYITPGTLVECALGASHCHTNVGFEHCTSVTIKALNPTSESIREFESEIPKLYS